MNYEELLNKLFENKDFSICEKSYNPQHFGNFNIDFLYKNRIKMQILNDRGIIEIFLIYKSLFSINTIPLGFAIDSLKNVCKKTIYNFSNNYDAYIFLINSIVYLDEIIEKDLLKNIFRNFKKIRERFYDRQSGDGSMIVYPSDRER